MSKHMDTVRKCYYPWKWLYVNINGDARPCCFSVLPLGNSLQDDAEKIWNGLSAQSLRRSLREGVLHSICRGAACKFAGNSEALEASEEPRPPADLDGFDEQWYVENYMDVRIGIERGRWHSGCEHFKSFGHFEWRYRNAEEAKRVTAEQALPPRPKQLKYDARVEKIGDTKTLHDESGKPKELVVRARLENRGSQTWPAHGVPEPVLPGLILYEDLIGNGKVMRESRGRLTHEVHSGDVIEIEMRLDLQGVTPGRYPVIIDLVYENRFWFSECQADAVMFMVEF
jgi:hypothetical protein